MAEPGGNVSGQPPKKTSYVFKDLKVKPQPTKGDSLHYEDPIDKRDKVKREVDDLIAKTFGQDSVTLSSANTVEEIMANVNSAMNSLEKK